MNLFTRNHCEIEVYSIVNVMLLQKMLHIEEKRVRYRGSKQQNLPELRQKNETAVHRASTL